METGAGAEDSGRGGAETPVVDRGLSEGGGKLGSGLEVPTEELGRDRCPGSRGLRDWLG